MTVLPAIVPAFGGTLPEESWIAPGPHKINALTAQPQECLARPDDPDRAYLVEVGRAAFRSPFLLGGPAARKGLSCESCHRNGHANPGFFIEGLSGAPGTADVTSSLFSKVRGDGVHNPVPIPDLHGIAGKDQFGTVAPVSSIEAFARDAITGEFQGAEPPEQIIDGLVAYIESLDTGICTSQVRTEHLTEKVWLGDIRRTLNATREAHNRDHHDVAGFLVLTARGLLGRLHERYRVQGLESLAARITGLSRQLVPVREGLGKGDPSVLESLDRVLKVLDEVESLLVAARGTSLFDRDTLIRYLADD